MEGVSVMTFCMGLFQRRPLIGLVLDEGLSVVNIIVKRLERDTVYDFWFLLFCIGLETSEGVIVFCNNSCLSFQKQCVLDGNFGNKG